MEFRRESCELEDAEKNKGGKEDGAFAELRNVYCRKGGSFFVQSMKAMKAWNGKDYSAR